MVSLDEFHGTLLRETFGGPVSDKDGLLLMAILYHHRIRFPKGLLKGFPEAETISALTTRGAAGSVAALWSDPRDPRSTETEWYWRWWGGDPINDLTELAEHEMQRLTELRKRLESHPWVKGIEPED